MEIQFDFIPIRDFPNYKICKEGLIINKHNKPMLGSIRTVLKKDGTYKKYRCIQLSNNKKRKSFLAHRLIALHFIPNPCNKPCVDHMDNDGLNNDLKNLRWATHSENQLNKIGKGYSIYKINSFKHRNKPWKCMWYIDLNRCKNKSKYFKTKELAQEYANSRNFPLQRDRHGIIDF